METTAQERTGERRAQREARREKQRAQSIVRAEKMRAARLLFERTAPAEDTIAAPDPAEQRLHIGCSGWYYWHWDGAFYPADIPRTAWFQHYAGEFDTVELNAPFYSWPTLSTVATWKRQCAGRRFTYAIKVNELITHTRRFVRTAGLVKDFGHIADLLGSRFGCFLFQLPPSFRYTRPALTRIVKQLDPGRRNVLEFRHASWWNDNVFAALRERNLVFCSTSAPRLPDALVKTSDDIYIRFHGTSRWYRHDYSREELDVWARRIADSGATRVWAYFNNDREGYAIANARELRRLLADR
jgi:uncharacterized protein YecE (DUF72 family)